MKQPVRHFFADKDIQIILGTLLRVGVVVSISVILIGALIYLMNKSGSTVDYGHFDAERAHYSHVGSILKGLLRLDGAAVIQCGIVLLIFTPVLRVAFSIFSFVIERDYLYVIIGLLVLFIILFSLSNTLAH